jgi:hypothetical protein
LLVDISKPLDDVLRNYMTFRHRRG